MPSETLSQVTVPGSIPGGLCHLGFLVAPGACWRPATAALLCRAHVTGPRVHVKVRASLAFWSQDAVLVPSLGGTVPGCHNLSPPGQPALLWWDEGSFSARLLQASSPCLCTDAGFLSKSSAFTSGSRSFTRPLGSSFSPTFLWPSRAQAFPSCKVRLSSGQTPALGSAALPRPEVVCCPCLPEARPPPCSPLSFDTRPPHLRDGNSSFPTARVQIQNRFLKLEFNCFTILC